MEKLIQWVKTYYEAMFILIIALICLIFSGLDFFGGVNALPWGLSAHIPTITLLFVVLTMSFLSLIQIKHINLLKGMQQELDNRLADHMHEALKQVDSSLRKVFAERYLTKMVHSFDDIMKRNSIKFDIEDHESYKYYNRHTLICFPKATFLATSRPLSFLWKDKKVLDDQELFIKRGGKIIRIFFLESNNDISSQEIKDVLEKQRQIGVDVYIAKHLHYIEKDYFMVEDKGKIAWAVEYNEDQEFKLGEATTDLQKTKKYCTDFGLIKKRADKYQPTITH